MSEVRRLSAAERAPGQGKTRQAVAALLRELGLPARGITVADDGTWSAGKVTGTWTDDGEAFLDES